MKESNIYWPRFLLEAVVIISSVFLALALDQWRQNRQNQQLVQRAKESIRSEIQSNKAALEAAVPYYEDQLNILREGSGESNVEFSRGLIMNSAWQTAQSTRVFSLMDYDEVDIISKIYDRQNWYLSIWDILAREVYGKTIQGDSEILKKPPPGIEYFINDLLTNQKQLLKLYDEALTALED